MKDPQPIDDLLSDCAPPKVRSVVADNTQLAEAIAAFLDLKQAGDERVAHLSLNWFYKTKLRDQFGGPKWFGTVRNYVREVLKRDLNTGLSL